MGQREDSFTQFISLGDKKDKSAVTVFENYSRGIGTSRDAWVYNASKLNLSANINTLIANYNSEVERYIRANEPDDLDSFLRLDPKFFMWTYSSRSYLKRKITIDLDLQRYYIGTYRPFTKSHIYFDKYLVHETAQMPRIFPNAKLKNRVISITGRGSTKDFCAFITDKLPDLEMISKGQCFPLKLYESASQETKDDNQCNLQNEMFALPINSEIFNDLGYTVKDGITDTGLAHFAEAYPNEIISKEDVFYYIYVLLHSVDYKQRYADNLSKELPRIPFVKKAADFWAFSQAGRELAELHINYETVTPYPVSFAGGALFMDSFEGKDYRVEQMKFGKKGKVVDKTTVIYNHKITITDIPLEAYYYVVNGKPALEWVMERQAVTAHKESGIVNDANLWATETMSDASYPLKLFQRVITVSLETMNIIRALPRLDI